MQIQQNKTVLIRERLGKEQLLERFVVKSVQKNNASLF